VSNARTLTASLEDYLEAILHVVREKSAARVKDIAGRMGVSASSVTGALRALADRRLINYAPYDIVTLTPQGAELAEDVVRRHDVLKSFFTRVLGVDDAEASEAACRMEHALSDTIERRLIRLLEHARCSGHGEQGWLRQFRSACEADTPKAPHGRPADGGSQKARTSMPERSTEGVPPLTLRELKPGTKARIIKVGGRGTARKRLADMGLTRGATIELIRVAPLGDPVEVRIRGYLLSLRKEEAAQVTIAPQ